MEQQTLIPLNQGWSRAKSETRLAWISSDYFESLLLPQLLKGENDSNQSDEFQAKTRPFRILHLGGRGIVFPPILSKIVWKVSTSRNSGHFINQRVILQHSYRSDTSRWTSRLEENIFHIQVRLEKDALEQDIARKSNKEFCDRVKNTINVISQESIIKTIPDYGRLPRWYSQQWWKTETFNKYC